MRPWTARVGWRRRIRVAEALWSGGSIDLIASWTHPSLLHGKITSGQSYIHSSIVHSWFGSGMNTIDSTVYWVLHSSVSRDLKTQPPNTFALSVVCSIFSHLNFIFRPQGAVGYFFTLTSLSLQSIWLSWSFLNPESCSADVLRPMEVKYPYSQKTNCSAVIYDFPHDKIVLSLCFL